MKTVGERLDSLDGNFLKGFFRINDRYKDIISFRYEGVCRQYCRVTLCGSHYLRLVLNGFGHYYRVLCGDNLFDIFRVILGDLGLNCGGSFGEVYDNIPRRILPSFTESPGCPLNPYSFIYRFGLKQNGSLMTQVRPSYDLKDYVLYRGSWSENSWAPIETIPKSAGWIGITEASEALYRKMLLKDFIV